MNSSKPLSFENILAGIIITVIGGIILAYLIQDARFSPKIDEQSKATADTFVELTPRSGSPVDGELPHIADQKLSSIFSNIQSRDFIVDATFFNPYDNTTGLWTYGFLFRNTDANQQFRLYVTSNQEWVLVLVYTVDGNIQSTSIANGSVSNLNITANAPNSLRLIAIGEIGYFFINGVFISTLPLSGKLSSGDIAVVAELTSDEVVGVSTTYKGFSVLSLEDNTISLVDGELQHEADQLLETTFANVQLRDFIVEATFFNPYDNTTGAWTYGFLFRNTDRNQQFRLYVNSNQEWVLILVYTVDGNVQSTLKASGSLSNLNITANAFNGLRLIALGETGYFFVNNVFISTLPLSGKLSSGSIAVAAELTFDEIVGVSTTFRGFKVLSIK